MEQKIRQELISATENRNLDALRRCLEAAELLPFSVCDVTVAEARLAYHQLKYGVSRKENYLNPVPVSAASPRQNRDEPRTVTSTIIFPAAKEENVSMAVREVGQTRVQQGRGPILLATGGTGTKLGEAWGSLSHPWAVRQDPSGGACPFPHSVFSPLYVDHHEGNVLAAAGRLTPALAGELSSLGQVSHPSVPTAAWTGNVELHWTPFSRGNNAHVAIRLTMLETAELRERKNLRSEYRAGLIAIMESVESSLQDCHQRTLARLTNELSGIEAQAREVFTEDSLRKLGQMWRTCHSAALLAIPLHRFCAFELECRSQIIQLEENNRQERLCRAFDALREACSFQQRNYLLTQQSEKVDRIARRLECSVMEADEPLMFRLRPARMSPNS